MEFLWSEELEERQGKGKKVDRSMRLKRRE